MENQIKSKTIGFNPTLAEEEMIKQLALQLNFKTRTKVLKLCLRKTFDMIKDLKPLTKEELKNFSFK